MLHFSFQIRKLMYLWREQFGDSANASEFAKLLTGKDFTANILMKLENSLGILKPYFNNMSYLAILDSVH